MKPPAVADINLSGAFYFYVTDEAARGRCIDSVKRSRMVGLDLETTSLDWWNGRVRLISLTTQSGETWVVDAFKVDPAPLYKALGRSHLVAHNAAFGISYLLRCGCQPRKVSCTRVLSRLLHAGDDRVNHNLLDVATRHAPKAALERLKAGVVDHEAWSRDTLSREELDYAANDSRYLLDIYRDELRVLGGAGLGEVAHLEERFVSVVAEAAATGMPVDPERWGEVIEESMQRKRELAEQLDKLLGPEVEIPEKFQSANADRRDIGKVNWSSPEQKVWAVETLGIDVPTRWDHKKGEERKTLDKNHLHLLNHPIADALLEYQAIANFPATFARAIVERFDGANVYPDWQQIQARTGRMSCQNPPMHNMPKKTKLREAVVAPEGYRVLALDFSQIEPRVLAAISGDRALLRAFRKAIDVYSFVASEVTQVPIEEVSDDLRKVFKTIVLGLIYGMSEYGLALRVHREIDPSIPTEQVVEYRDGFFAAFPEASRWRESLEREFHNGSRETRTILGRRRKDVENPRQRWNAPIQGTATDAFKLAAVRLLERREEVGEFRIVALIHDEVVIVAPEEKADEVEEWARNVMEEAAAEVLNKNLPKKLHIPILVDSGSGQTLQEATENAG